MDDVFKHYRSHAMECPAACYLGLGQTEADRPNCICPVAPAIARAKLLEELAERCIAVNDSLDPNVWLSHDLRIKEILAALKEK